MKSVIELAVALTELKVTADPGELFISKSRYGSESRVRPVKFVFETLIAWITPEIGLESINWRKLCWYTNISNKRSNLKFLTFIVCELRVIQ